MMTEQMTVHEALSELKMLDRRIANKIEDTVFAVANKHANTKINGVTLEEYKKQTLSEYQSINDMIRRRKAIRNALSISNAKTTIQVSGKTFTVAEAIEYKAGGLGLQRHLLNALQTAYEDAQRNMERANKQLDDQADRYIKDLFGAKEKANPDDVKATRDAYIAAQTFDFVDPLHIKDEMEKLSAEIDTFEHEIDSKLSVSNALTTLTIEY